MTTNPHLAPFAASAHDSPPDRLGQRYEPGRFLPEAGNTIVCHLDLSDPRHEAVLDARARLQALPEASRFLFTPVESLHMTLFEGVIETRRTEDAWPAGMDRSASIEAVTDVLKDRFDGFQAPPRFQVRAEAIRPTGLVLTGATEDDTASMWAWREALTTPFGYRHANHDAYTFHMTFAYPLDWIPDDLLPEWDAAYQAILAALTAEAPILPLKPPAFCTFPDMTRFDPVLVLGD